MKFLLRGFSGSVVLLVLILVCTTSWADDQVEVGDVPPAEVGWDLEGNQISLTEFDGQIVVVSFWASWCPPCHAELELLENIQDQVPVDELRVVAVNVLEPDQDQIRRAIGQMEDASLLYTFDRRNSVSGRYGIERLPRMMMLDREGRIARQHVGYNEEMLDTIVDELNELLAGE